MKRLLSILLVLTMLCSLCTVFAQEEAPAEETAAEEVTETAPEEPAAEEPAAEPADEAAEEAPAEESAEEAPAEEAPAEEPAEEAAEEPAADREEAPAADGESVLTPENYSSITTGSYITGEQEYCNYMFTPDVSGVYVIYSTGEDMDPSVEIYEKNSNDDGYSKVAGNDDRNDEDYNFLIGYYMTADVEYSIEIDGEEDGGVPFTLTAGYAVRYDANGGTGAPALQGKAPGVALTLTGDQPTRGGYSFVGWAVSDTATAAEYASGDSYTADGDVTLFAVWQAADASGSCGAEGDNVTWSIDTETNVLTITGSGMMDDYIEENVPWYLFRSVITAVHIGEGVTYIGLNAFRGCSAATEVTIPASVTSVCFHAVKGCAGEIRYAGSKETWADVDISGSGLEGRSVTCTDGATDGWSFVNGTLTVGGTGAMSDYTYNDDQPWNCFKDSITSVVIERGITGIGSYAFYKFGNLTSVVIPEGVTSIGQSAFERCGKLADVTLPGSLLDIGESAFCWCSSLKSIAIPSTVKGIGDFAFQYSGLTGISLAEGLQSIGQYAFDGSGLQSVTIPSSVTTIGEGAFRGCGSLTEIVIPSTVTSLGTKDLFYGCSGLTAVTLPDSLTSIGYEMFENCGSLTGITIPSTVTSIGDYAFLGCGKLAEITIPAGVTSIGTRAFEGCDDLAVSYAGTCDGWASVSQSCLSDACVTCTDGTAGTGWKYASGTLTVTVDGAMPDHTADGAPYESLKSQITDVEIESGVTSIGAYAFYGCTGIARVIVPEGVTSIGAYAFAGCTGIDLVDLPESLTAIGVHAFEGSTPVVWYEGTTAQWAEIAQGVGSLNPTTVSAADETIEMEWSVDENGVLTISGAGAMDLEMYNYGGPWYSRWKDITSIVIKSGITSIGANAFYQLSKVVSVTIPATVTVIDESAFDGCDQLKDVYYNGSLADWQAIDFGDGVIQNAPVHTLCTITYDATYGSGAPAAQTGYTGTALTLSSTVPTFWRGKLLGWTDGTDLVQPGAAYTPTQEAVTLTAVWGQTGTCGAGSDGANLTWTMNFTTGVLSITGEGAMADYSENIAPWGNYRNSVKSISVGSGVTSISEGAFYRCVNVTSVTIPAGVTEIGAGAFYGCSSLQSFTVEEGNTNYTAADGVLFSSDMTELVACPNAAAGIYTIPDSVTVIGDEAFAGCAKLTAVTIPAGVTEIGARAFYDCDRLTGVTLPAGLTVLSAGVFEECGKLTDITIPAGVTSIESGAFAECASLEEIVIPDTVKTMGDSVFWMCTSLKSVTLPAGLTAIGAGMFENCSSLTEITLPAGVTEIGGSAFDSCSLTEISIPIGVTSIGDGAFNCTKLTDVYYAGSEAGRNAMTIGGSNDKLTNAAWHYELYTITYDANGGEGAPKALTVPAGQAVTLDSTEPTRSGCTFQGWAVTNDAAEAAYQPGDGYQSSDSVTMYAVWKAEPVTITANRSYTADITQGLSTIRYTYTPTVSRTYVLYAKDGGNVKIALYNEDGTALATGTDRLAYPMTADTTYYYTVSYADTDTTGSIALKFGRVYTVKFKANGGTGAPAAQTRDYGSTLNLTDEKPVMAGYDFAGWAVSADAEKADYEAGASYTANGNVTLYAVWKTASGSCGTDVTWTIDENGLLTVSYTGTGSGAEIDGSAWSGHKSAITGVIIKGSITGLGDSAFAGCTALKSIYIPSSVTSVGSGVFDGCGRLKNVYYCGTEAGWTAFGVTVPENCAVRYEAHQWGEGTLTKEATFTENGTMQYVCTLCGEVKEEATPRQGTVSGECGAAMTWTLDAEGLLTISGTGTMYDYDGDDDAPWKEYEDYLYTAVIEDGAESIGAYAFWSLDKLTGITIADSVQAIGRGAFKECISLHSVVIPDGVTVIESDTFNYCWGYDPEGLQSVTIPASVKEICEDAFADCYDLEDVYYGGTKADRDALIIGDGNEYLTGSGEEDDAVWHYAVSVVTYNANGGEGAPEAAEYTTDKAAALSTVRPTREGFVFLGWAADKDAVTADYAAGASVVPEGDMTLYAVWAETLPLTGHSYTARITEAGGAVWYTYTPTVSKTFVLYSTSGKNVQIAVYNADGELVTSGSGVGARAACGMTAGETYLFRVGLSKNTATGSIGLRFGRVYTVRYNANGGIGAPAVQTRDYGASLTLSNDTPTRSGYTFAGWSTVKNGPVSYQPGEAYTANSNATLYAVWEAES